MLGPEFEAVTGCILDSESRLRGEMTRRFDRVDVRFDEFRKELKGDIGEVRGEIGELRTELKGEIGDLKTELKGEIGEIKDEIRELKGLIVTNVKRRKR